MKKLIIIIVFVAVILGLVYFLLPQETVSWSWTLEGGQWEEITFTQEMFNITGGTEPEVVLASIFNVSGDVWVYQYQPDWVTWCTVENELAEMTNILPDVICYIRADNSCTLVIEGVKK